MSEKVTLTIEGSAEDILNVCRIIASGGWPEEGEETWEADEVKEFWGAITPGARRALKEIATRPSGYPRDDLLKALALTGNQLAGTLSSVGHQMKNFPEKPWPVELDWEEGVYHMPPEAANVISKLAP